ncbi:Apolipoprotein N-acyltransferase / Copper homeostasis protein CutE [hydrothermal vent metagenome]|uniref:Apolipoprotein N-acyltransferase / Copper homeostasis protein CutE n=1 Tax=hydrothermal vent metagenome TaxID=652676 RepID=A0A3B0ZDB4_9ZZZZ
MNFSNDKWHVASTLIAGAILPLAFAPHNYYVIALFSLAVLFISWIDATPKQAFLRGWFFGVGLFGFGVTWIYTSMHDYGGVSFGLSIFLVSLFVSFLALFPAFSGMLVARLLSSATKPIACVCLLASSWVFIEWVRGMIFTGFPWLNVGYSQIEGPLSAFAPVLGVYGISGLLALLAAILAWVFVRRKFLWVTGYLLFASIITIGLGLSQLQWTQTLGKPIKVSLIQGNIPQDMKWLPELRQPSMDLYRDLSRDNWDSDLIIWPETALPDFYHRSLGFIDDLNIEAQQNKTDILLGVLYMDIESDRYYNSVIALSDKNNAFYHKRHLVPFTEYLPMKSVLGALVDFMNVPMSNFGAGKKGQTLLHVAGVDVGVSICFEDAFGEEMIALLPQASVLVNVSNDAWFEGTDAPYQHLQMAQMRALELGRPMLRATNTGVTAVMDHLGRFQSIAPNLEIAVLTESIQPMKGITPYVRFGNAPVVICFLLILAFGVYNIRNSA